MKILQTALDGVLIVDPMVFIDDRGFFMETYQKIKYQDLGILVEFVQDNLSFSRKGTLRGLHYQHPHGQAKLVQVLGGHAYDVTVDVRRGAKNFGQWVGVHLSDENKRQVYIPAGFAHGFCVLSNTALFSYKCSDLYTPKCERGVRWDDPDLAIEWPINNPVLSEKDSKYPRLRDVPVERLPGYEKKV